MFTKVKRFQQEVGGNAPIGAGGDKPHPYPEGWWIWRRGGLYARPHRV